MPRSAVVLPLLFAAGLLGQTVETIPLRAILSSENEVQQQPPSLTTGNATVSLHVVRDAAGKIMSGSVDAAVSYNFTNPGTITAMHIHRGGFGTEGPVVLPFTITRTEANGRGVLPTTQTAFPSTAVPVDVISDILADPGQFYFNVHSADAPNGVMRGQLERAETIVRMGLMIPEKETPTITSKPWKAVGTVMVLMTRSPGGTPTSAYIIFDVAYTGFPDNTNFTGLHIHRGAAGVAGPITIDSGLRGPVAVQQGGSGVLHFENEVDLTRAGALETLTGLVTDPSSFYINLHTTEAPSGAVRSQLLTTDSMEFQVQMTTENEVPPITNLQAQTAGEITVYTVRDSRGDIQAGAVVFDVNPAFPADTQFTGLHIHDAVAGKNGDVTIDSRLSSQPILVGSGGSGSIYRLVTVGSGQALTSLRSLVLNPSQHYVNIHTSVNRGGANRAQLGTVGELPSITSVQAGVPGAVSVMIAPGSIFLITGTSLANVGTTISGINNLQALPASLNGVSVTFGGITAPLSSVSPTAITGQVPFDVDIGNVEVIVTTPNGASQSVIVKVAPAAPAITYGPRGVVAVRASDGTPVTQATPASPGDLIIVTVAGLGQTNPPLTTGAIVDPNQAFTASGLSARIGGTNTSVVSATAAPGSNGLYNVTIRVPEGILPGNAPMLLQSGLTTSNVVALPVVR